MYASMYTRVHIHIDIHEDYEYPAVYRHFHLWMLPEWQASQEEILPLPLLTMSVDRTQEYGSELPF